MNVHTFKDVVKSKRSSLANDLDDDGDDDDAALMEGKVDGEEEEGDDKFNEAGEVLEAFNLHNERDGGAFDENMNYVFQKEKGEMDAWVAEMDETAMEQAIGEAARAVKRKAAQRELDEENEAKKEFLPSIQLKKNLLLLMKPKETVAGAMRRLGGGKAAGAAATNKSDGIVRRRAPPSTSDGHDADTHTSSQAKMKEKLAQQRDARNNRAQVDRITEIADELLTRGLTGVFNMTYEALRASTLTWEYKGLTDGQIHGPFTAQQLAGWKAQGYFAGATAVMVRPVGENHLSDAQMGSSADGGTDSPGALASLRALGVNKPNMQAGAKDSIYDDDDIYDTKEVGGASSAPTVAPVPVEWVNSDTVDFGEYVNLDQAQQQMQQQVEQRKRQAMASKATTATERREIPVSRAGVERKKVSFGADEQLGDSADEDEDVEGLSYRRKGKSAGRRTKDQPDSDDDDNE